MFIFVKSFTLTLIYAVSYFLFYNQVYNRYPGDLSAHINYINHLDIIAHPLWHLSIKYISVLFSISIGDSVILFTSFLIVGIFIIINCILNFTLKHNLHDMPKAYKQYVLLFMSLALLVASAIYVPFFNKYLYLGQSSCGIWHNVTILMVKPFAFLSMFFTVLYLQTKERKYFILGVFLTITSIFAKPNYIIMFLPSLYIFYIYYVYKYEITSFKDLMSFDTIKSIYRKHRYFLIYIFSITFFSVLILISQYLQAFGEGNQANAGVILDFLGVWSLYTPNVLVSLLLAVLFPIFVLIFIRNSKSDFYILSIIMFFISVALYVLLAESGPRYDHGNFAWTLHIAYHVFFLFSTVEFLKGYQKLNNWKKYILSITLSLHIISGLFYFTRILNGGSYL